MKIVFGGAAVALLLASPAFATSLTNSDSATATASVISAVTVQKQADLSFGTVVVGDGTVEVATNGTPTYTSINHATGTVTAADFAITADGGQTLDVELTSPSTLSDGNSHTIAYAVNGDTANIGASVAMGGTLYTPSTIHAKVGGKITLTSSTVPGTYTGSLTVTATYN